MAWMTPLTWVDNVLVTVDDLNTYVRDNLDALKNPPSTAYRFDNSGNFSTSSNNFVNVDATVLSLDIETRGGDVFVGFFGNISPSAAPSRTYFDLFSTATASRVGGDDGLIMFEVPSSSNDRAMPIGFMIRISGLAAGAYSFRLQWKVSSGTVTLYAGAGTSGYDVHGQFWARELS